jgi:hypothetical protein
LVVDRNSRGTPPTTELPGPVAVNVTVKPAALVSVPVTPPVAVQVVPTCVVHGMPAWPLSGGAGSGGTTGTTGGTLVAVDVAVGVGVVVAVLVGVAVRVAVGVAVGGKNCQFTTSASSVALSPLTSSLPTAGLVLNVAAPATPAAAVWLSCA